MLFLAINPTQHLIVLESRAESHCHTGIQKVGYMAPTHGVGFNGIADTILDDGLRKWMESRLKDGAALRVILVKYLQTVTPVTAPADPGKDRHFCNGLTTPLFEY